MPVLFPPHPFAKEVSELKNLLNHSLEDGDIRLKIIHKLEKEVIKLREDRIEELKKFEVENATHIEIIKIKKEEIKLLQQKGGVNKGIIRQIIEILKYKFRT